MGSENNFLQLPHIGFAFVAQDVYLRRQDEGGRQALEPLVRRLKRRGIDILPFSSSRV